MGIMPPSSVRIRQPRRVGNPGATMAAHSMKAVTSLLPCFYDYIRACNAINPVLYGVPKTQISVRNDFPAAQALKHIFLYLVVDRPRHSLDASGSVRIYPLYAILTLPGESGIILCSARSAGMEIFGKDRGMV